MVASQRKRKGPVTPSSTPRAFAVAVVIRVIVLHHGPLSLICFHNPQQPTLCLYIQCSNSLSFPPPFFITPRHHPHSFVSISPCSTRLNAAVDGGHRIHRSTRKALHSTRNKGLTCHTIERGRQPQESTSSIVRSEGDPKPSQHQCFPGNSKPPPLMCDTPLNRGVSSAFGPFHTIQV